MGCLNYMQDHPGLGSDTSLLRNVFSHSSDSILWETCGRVSNCWLFSQAKFVPNLPPHLGQHSFCTLLDGYFFNDVMALKCVIFMKVEMILVVE